MTGASLNGIEMGDINLKEIKFVFDGNLSQTIWDTLHSYDNGDLRYYYLIGFSNEYRFIQIVIASDGDTVYFIQVKVADNLNEIREDFFNKL